jgi:hypothetical protein
MWVGSPKPINLKLSEVVMFDSPPPNKCEAQSQCQLEGRMMEREQHRSDGFNIQ